MRKKEREREREEEKKRLLLFEGKSSIQISEQGIQ